MSSAHAYLAGLLQAQTLPPERVAALQRLRVETEGALRAVYGSAPRFYYGGSYGKDTMILAAYDLDIVMYFPPTEQASLAEIFLSVYGTLKGAGYIVVPRTVALRLPYEGGFHVDVVPGRAQDVTFRYATLFKSPNGTLQTSLKIHIDAVRKTGIRDIVRLMKLWRARHQLTCSTFALETIIGLALQGEQKTDYARCIQKVLEYIALNILTARLIDPANSNNEIEVKPEERLALYGAAATALRASNWGQIIW